MKKSRTCIRKKFDSHDSILKDYVYERSVNNVMKKLVKREKTIVKGSNLCMTIRLLDTILISARLVYVSRNLQTRTP